MQVDPERVINQLLNELRNRDYTIAVLRAALDALEQQPAEEKEDSE